MGLLEENEDIFKKHQELCRNLNLDLDAANQAWDSYETIRQNYVLEGDQLHWLGCALYVACRKISTPSVGQTDSVVHGNGVNLTRLLGLCNMSLKQFFNKSKQWINMASMPPEFSQEIERLERNFQVSTVIFQQYLKIFYDMFETKVEDTSKLPRSRKRTTPCTSAKILEFCWTLFIYMKGENSEISADLVTSYHYLLACCDLMFANAFVGCRYDILRKEFPGLPADWTSPRFKFPLEPPSVIDILCTRHQAIALDAKVIKSYAWKDYMKTFINKKILRCPNPNTFCGLLDQECFEYNLKNINREYETYVLSRGDFDERIFLAECRRLQRMFNSRTVLQEIQPDGDANLQISSVSGDANDNLNARRHRIGDDGLETRPSISDTPYTGRIYLRGRREVPAGSTLVTTATNIVSHLRTLLAKRKPSPSVELLEIFKNCENNPLEKITTKLKEFGGLFVSKYLTNNTNYNENSRVNFAKERLELAETLYYKLLEDIIMDEKRKKPDFSFSGLLNQDIFHQCLFAISVEIIIFSYNSQNKFPWVLEALNLEAFYFYKIIEPVVCIRDHLSRDLVKHLNTIEEQILQAMAWKNDSPLWSKIAESEMPIPSCADCSTPSVQTAQMQQQTVHITQHDHSVVEVQYPRTTADEGSQPQMPMPIKTNEIKTESPISSTSERFQSPITYTNKRRLLQDTQKIIKPGQSLLQNQTKMYLSICGDKLIPVVIQSTNAPPVQNENGTPEPPPTTTIQPSEPIVSKTTPRSGSLALFFRKFYNLAHVRMKFLCDDLDLSDDTLRLKIWTCFEHSIMNHTELMRDRHLDQILMCAIYVVCKVVGGKGTERSFTDIMRCYRSQPQASSDVYRSVLLIKRPLDTGTNISSNSSDTPSEPEQVVPQQQHPATAKAAPLTPSQLAGTATSFPHEDRGDLIKFYNTIYIQKIQSFALGFTNRSQSQNLVLSPLPSRTLIASPTRRISDRVYVRSLTKSSSTATVKQSPTAEPLIYCFSRSPAKDLRAINDMINFNKPGKRRLLNDDSNEDDKEDDVKPAKKIPTTTATVVGGLQRKIHGLLSDRLEQAKEKE